MKYLILLISYIVVIPMTLATETPISLTASDGSGLEMRRLEARVVLDGFLAFTELEMVFYNPEARQREGRFQITLPHNAAISRFAMKIENEWQEGEVVEKQLARRAYEDFLHQRQDPALLEVDSGNRFNARIFPIAPQAEKFLLISYSQRLDNLDNQYILPLQGLPLLKQLSIKVFHDSDEFSTAQLGELTASLAKRNILSINKQDYQPTQDFKMPYQGKQASPLALQSDSLIAAKIIPFPAKNAASKEQPFEKLVLLIDTSASQAPYLATTLARLESLLPLLNIHSLHIYTFDQTFNTVGISQQATNHLNLIQQVKARQALGASRLDEGLTILKSLPLESARLLLLSDTVITAGETSGVTLANLLKQIPWLTRVDILIPSSHSDQQVAHTLVTAGKTPGIVATMTLSDAQLLTKLTHTVHHQIPIQLADSKWFWPEQVETLQTDEPLIIFAEMNQASNAIHLQIGDNSFNLMAQPANAILLKREWVRARLDKLLGKEETTSDVDMKNAFHNEIINLSVKERVLSPYTSLLVLETEADYQRYQIDRKGLADILTIGVDGLTVIKRSDRKVEIVPPPEFIPGAELDKGLEDAKEKSLPAEKKVDVTENAPRPATPPMRQPTTISHSRNGNSGGMADRMAPAASIAANGREDELEVRDGFSLGDDDLEAFPATNDAPADAVRNESVAGTISREEHEFQRRRGVIPSPIAQEGSASAVRGIREDTSSVREHNDSLASMEINSLEELSLELSDNANEELARMRERVAPAVAPQSAKPSTPPFWSGRYAEFRALLDKSDLKAAGNFAQQWHQDDLADMMALIALGEWYEKNNQVDQAIRAYGSLIDYFPGRAEIRRWVAERLLPLNHPDAQWLCVNALEKALAQRADHPSGHYLLAIAYWQVKLYRQAVMILQTAKDMSFPRFPEANRILRETFALMLTTLQQQGQLTTLFPTQTFVWEKAEQQQIRFVLMWETDANDVDLHVYDNQQNHAYYGERSLPTGGTLYADITTGFGPECFQIPEPKAFPYKIQAHYYNMGPMGYGMGMVHILRYQPLKGISSESRPFVVMQNRAFVDLGEVTY